MVPSTNRTDFSKITFEEFISFSQTYNTSFISHETLIQVQILESAKWK